MKNFIVGAACLLFSSITIAQDFTPVVENPSTEVKNQQRTGTCWCYSTLSFLESEMLREGRGTFDFAEMYIVNKVYQNKAQQYMMQHGKGNFSQGGQAHDVMRAISQVGLITQDEYPGNEYSEKGHNHSEMVAGAKGMLNGILEKKSKGELTLVWHAAMKGILDAYLGATPNTFQYEGKDYTTSNFAKEVVDFDINDYVELTSYSHHPYYSQFVLEVPDNWSNDLYYNVPIDDLMTIMKQSLELGYTFVWDGDVSEEGFSHQKAIATLPEGTDVSQQARQTTFEAFTTTDDHLMHIVGLSEKEGETYFTTKNSWGNVSNKAGGLLYISEDYVSLKTVAILVNKKSIPKNIAKKLFNGNI